MGGFCKSYFVKIKKLLQICFLNIGTQKLYTLKEILLHWKQFTHSFPAPTCRWHIIFLLPPFQWECISEASKSRVKIVHPYSCINFSVQLYSIRLLAWKMRWKRGRKFAYWSKRLGKNINYCGTLNTTVKIKESDIFFEDESTTMQRQASWNVTI